MLGLTGLLHIQKCIAITFPYGILSILQVNVFAIRDDNYFLIRHFVHTSGECLCHKG